MSHSHFIYLTNPKLRGIKRIIYHLKDETARSFGNDKGDETDELSILQPGFEETVDEFIRILEQDSDDDEVTFDSEPVRGGSKMKTGFHRQIEELEELKKEFPDNIFPFLAVDPRREGIFELVQEKAGAGKPFTGIKIYPSLGYLPSDPVLMKIFRFCETNKIPVTTHCSRVFITTLKNPEHFRGFLLKEIYDRLCPAVGSVVTSIDNYEFVEIDQEIKMPRILNLALVKKLEQRSGFFGDPYNWLPVLKECPKLILNLAHFGNSGELGKYMRNPFDTSSWTYRIVEILENPKYPNVYTDISHFTDDDSINAINTFLDKKPKLLDRIMYGSDFSILMLTEKTFDDYIDPFKDVRRLKKVYFGKMATETPRKFLGI